MALDLSFDVTTSGSAKQVTTLSDGSTNLAGGTTYTCWAAEFDDADSTYRECSSAGSDATVKLAYYP